MFLFCKPNKMGGKSFAVFFCCLFLFFQMSLAEESKKQIEKEERPGELDASIEKAARQGNTYFQFDLGVLYDRRGDTKKALYWYKKAALKKYPPAQAKLGEFYFNKKDYPKALYWYERAARQNDASAQHNLGQMYYKGEGVPKDHKKAVYWYRRASIQGVAAAQYRIALMHHKGEGGLQKDYTQAMYWNEKAAEQGVVLAQYNLAKMYFYGEGGFKDNIKAYKWMSLAKSKGKAPLVVLNADKYLHSLEKDMSSSELETARRLASQFKTKNFFDTSF